jgi:hypothetical protein
MQVDKELETESGKEELTNMKKKSPPNKSPLFKILEMGQEAITKITTS